ncbi:SDR family oxidoreductase [Arthrobacter sp. RAF14]|uniref:SDR family oxidoreductase n=1 Tax=Arthrobacter sp. RAF14 TaxID=3233051 RepID=UPI003F8DA0AB
MSDQYTFRDPVTLFPEVTPPIQHQEPPGLDVLTTPGPDLGAEYYRGLGRLQNRKALITGGDSGIGAAVAIAFAREGADVAISYLPEEEDDASRIIELIEKAGGKALKLPADLRDPDAPAALVADVVDGLGGLDILVSNAGRQVATAQLEEIDDRQFEETFQINVFAMIRLIRAAVPHMPPGSSIVASTSIQAYKPSSDLLDYASTKAAINNLTKGLAQQLAPQGIRVNAVAPGPVWTALQVSGGQLKESLPEFGKDTALGRAGHPAEMAPCYVFLASSESSFVVGETLNANGGIPSP